MKAETKREKKEIEKPIDGNEPKTDPVKGKRKKVRIEVSKIMNPAFLVGTAFSIAY
jgi:hypothetical protein